MKHIPQDNYNKKIAPFRFDKINNVNIPVNIRVSMAVIDIINFAEVASDVDEDDQLLMVILVMMEMMKTNVDDNFVGIFFIFN